MVKKVGVTEEVTIGMLMGELITHSLEGGSQLRWTILFEVLQFLQTSDMYDINTVVNHFVFVDVGRHMGRQHAHTPNTIMEIFADRASGSVELDAASRWFVCRFPQFVP